MTQFNLVTRWRFRAPAEAVWRELTRPEDWPLWWRGVLAVELLEPGDASGVGAYRRMVWRTALPYRITFNMRTVRVEPHSRIEGIAEGELRGRGIWRLTQVADVTDVRYDWSVDVTRPWMGALAPLLKPLFEWNHDVVMRWGSEGLARRLKEREFRESP